MTSRIGLLVALVALVATGALLAADERIDAAFFTARIAPIIAERCDSCHGDAKQKGGLRLDSPAAIRAGGKQGAVLVPGKPEISKLYTLTILPEGDDDLMPAKNGPLRAEQIDLLRRWIAAGAPMPEAAAAPPAKAAPAVKTAAGAGDGKAAAPITTDVDRLSAGAPAPDAALLRDLRARGLVVTPLSTNGALLDVDCSHAQPPVGSADLAKLAPIAASICWLDLGGSAISDGDLAALAAMPHLTRLHLERTAIGDAAGPRLATCTRLEYLNLVGTRIGDAGIAALAGLPAVDAVYLWQSKASEAGIAALRAALPEAVIDSGPALEPSTTPPPKRKRRKQQ